jgi:ABC-type Fe3+-hydroxamate transport system substrate-binding protein
MSRIGVLVAAATALAACREDSKGAGGGKANAQADTVSVTGVVSAVDPDNVVEVTTDEGRKLTLKMNEAMTVTLAGGAAQTAVIAEGAPVRVSYRPKGSGGDLVAVDVEPQATTGRGEAKDVPRTDPPADPGRAARQGR